MTFSGTFQLLNSQWTLLATFNLVLNLAVFVFCRKKIEEIGKMTALSQEEIISNTKTVVQGLDTLKVGQ